MIPIKNKYRITLFNSRWMENFFTYDYPLLPNTGDIIEIFRNELFVIKERVFPIHNNNELIDVTLTGLMENDDHQSRLSWDDFKEKLRKSENEDEIPVFDGYKLPVLDISNDLNH